MKLARCSSPYPLEDYHASSRYRHVDRRYYRIRRSQPNDWNRPAERKQGSAKAHGCARPACACASTPLTIAIQDSGNTSYPSRSSTKKQLRISPMSLPQPSSASRRTLLVSCSQCSAPAASPTSRFCTACGAALTIPGSHAIAPAGISQLPVPSSANRFAGMVSQPRPGNPPIKITPPFIAPTPDASFNAIQSRRAVAALVLAALSFVLFPVILSIPAIMQGYKARREIREAEGQLTGEGTARAAIVMGYINLVYFALGLMIICAYLPLVLLS